MSVPALGYRTYQVWIKPGHRLFAYLDALGQCAKNLYNTANFYIRQVFTAKGQLSACQPLQQQVMNTLSAHLDAMNERRSVKNRSRPFTLPSPEQPFLSFFLGCLVQSDGATRLSLPPGPKQPRHSEGRLPELGGLFRQHEGVSSTSGDLYRQAEDSGLRPQQGEGSGVLESRLRHQRPKVPEVPPNQAETEHRQARAYRRQVHAGACRTSSWALCYRTRLHVSNGRAEHRGGTSTGRQPF
ncbi:hypothetical protein PAEVO_19550 [Paenibacillus sp. GM2FR]|nr:hypothetical protein PAEVO_19550 [Paenibacillus sp. GM2FR]